MRKSGVSGRPRSATFGVETVEKPDGRKVHYYAWAEAPDTDREPGAARPPADEPPSSRPDRV